MNSLVFMTIMQSLHNQTHMKKIYDQYNMDNLYNNHQSLMAKARTVLNWYRLEYTFSQ